MLVSDLMGRDHVMLEKTTQTLTHTKTTIGSKLVIFSAVVLRHLPSNIEPVVQDEYSPGEAA